MKNFLIEHLPAVLLVATILVLVGLTSCSNNRTVVSDPPVAHTQFKTVVDCGTGWNRIQTVLYTQKEPVCDKPGNCSSLGGPAFQTHWALSEIFSVVYGDQETPANLKCSVATVYEPRLWSSQKGRYPEAHFTTQSQIDKFLQLTSGQ